VSGWRPAVGWLCVVALAWAFIGLPVVQAICTFKGMNVVLPDVETLPMMELVLGMLGLGGLRTFEKVKGVAAK